jgi:chorismate mutase
MVDFPKKGATTIAFLHGRNPKMATEKSLDKLRQEIDKLDDTIHDAIMRRADIVQQVGAFKAGKGMPALRPAREAEILRRLVARHQGKFPKTVILRIWREMIGAMVSLEAPLTLAVYMPERGSGYLDLARDHYGSYTPTTVFRSPGQVVRAVAEGSATVGVVPLPDGEDVEPWWVSLMGDAADLPRIMARLPFVGPGPGRGDGIEALAIARLSPDPTGFDRSWLAVETPPDTSRTRLRTVLGAAGLEPTLMVATHRTENAWLHLVEISGHLAPDDRRLTRMIGRREAPVVHAAVLGGYPVPMSAEDVAE